MESYLENKYSETEVLIQSAFNEAKKLEKMEDADYNFSLAHYNVTKKMMEIELNISKVSVKKKIENFNNSVDKRLNRSKEKGFKFITWDYFKKSLKKIKNSIMQIVLILKKIMGQ